MSHLDFALRLNSPAFASGAPGEEETRFVHRGQHPRRFPIGPGGDGIRIPTLRGVLRFWFRAKEGHRELRDLADREGEIFGSTEHGQGLRIVPRGESAWEPEPVRAGQGTGKAYLGYGPLAYRDGSFTSEHKHSVRWAVPAGTDFSFRAIGTDEQLEELLRTLALLHLFGGVGARSRRGWGSVAVGAQGLPRAAKGESLDRWLQRFLERAWPPGEVPSPWQVTGRPRYSAFSRHTLVYRTPAEAGYEAIFEAFHRRFRATRLWWTRPGSPSDIARADHDLERCDARADGRDALTGVPRRLAYGLPYAPASRQGEWEIDYRKVPGPRRDPDGEPVSKKETTARRASPLLLKVLPIATNRCVGVALLLDATFFGDPDAEIGADGKVLTQPPPDTSAIRAFLEHEEPRGGRRKRPWKRIPLPGETEEAP